VPDVVTAPDAMAETALACQQAAAEIGHRLTGLKRLLVSLEDLLTATTPTTPTQFQALKMSFDIYAHMLDDTLEDIAAGPCHHLRRTVTPHRSSGPAPRGASTPGEHPDPRTTLKAGAGGVIGELHSLKRVLEPLRNTCCAAARTRFASLRNEWDIAVDGLLGQTGVLGHIAGGMNLEWTSHRAAMWGDSARGDTDH
jgi:hypothetical protein